MVGVIEVEDQVTSDLTQIGAFHSIEEVSAATVGRMPVGAVPEWEKHAAAVRIQPHHAERRFVAQYPKAHSTGTSETRAAWTGMRDFDVLIVGGSKSAVHPKLRVVIEIAQTLECRPVFDWGLGMGGEEQIPVGTPGLPWSHSVPACPGLGILFGDLAPIVEEFKDLAHSSVGWNLCGLPTIS